MIWLEVATTNDDSSVIAQYYMRAVCKCDKPPYWFCHLDGWRNIRLLCYTGCPREVHADGGTENSKIAYLLPFLRRNDADSLAGSNSFQYSISASNQVFFCVMACK